MSTGGSRQKQEGHALNVLYVFLAAAVGLLLLEMLSDVLKERTPVSKPLIAMLRRGVLIGPSLSRFAHAALRVPESAE